MLIKLTKQEMHECKILGQDTVKICKMQKLTPRLDTEDESRVLSNIQGFYAEYAVAKALGCKFPMFNIVTDGGVDVWAGNISIDVKYTKNTTDLIFDDFSEFKADVAVLTSPSEVGTDVIKIIGWLDKTTFVERSFDKDYGYGSRKVVSKDNLFFIEKLWLKVIDDKYSPHYYHT